MISELWRKEFHPDHDAKCSFYNTTGLFMLKFLHQLIERGWKRIEEPKKLDA